MFCAQISLEVAGGGGRLPPEGPPRARRPHRWTLHPTEGLEAALWPKLTWQWNPSDLVPISVLPEGALGNPNWEPLAGACVVFIHEVKPTHPFCMMCGDHGWVLATTLGLSTHAPPRPTPAEALGEQLQVVIGSHELLQAGQLADARGQSIEVQVVRVQVQLLQLGQLANGRLEGRQAGAVRVAAGWPRSLPAPPGRDSQAVR